LSHIQWTLSSFDADSVVKQAKKKSSVGSRHHENFKCHLNVTFASYISPAVKVVLHAELIFL
jgi:hypothetical protein